MSHSRESRLQKLCTRHLTIDVQIPCWSSRSSKVQTCFKTTVCKESELAMSKIATPRPKDPLIQVMITPLGLSGVAAIVSVIAIVMLTMIVLIYFEHQHHHHHHHHHHIVWCIRSVDNIISGSYSWTWHVPKSIKLPSSKSRTLRTSRMKHVRNWAKGNRVVFNLSLTPWYNFSPKSE